MAKTGKAVDGSEQTSDEGIEEVVQRLGETDDPAILYVIERWGNIEVGDTQSLVIEGSVTELYVSWQLKRGEYNSEIIHGHIKVRPDNLKCDIVVPKAATEIVEGGDDLAIMEHVFRRIAAQLGVQAQGAMIQHMGNIYAAKEKKAKRVDAKEVPTTTSVEL